MLDSFWLSRTFIFTGFPVGKPFKKVGFLTLIFGCPGKPIILLLDSVPFELQHAKIWLKTFIIILKEGLENIIIFINSSIIMNFFRQLLLFQCRVLNKFCSACASLNFQKGAGLAFSCACFPGHPKSLLENQIFLQGFRKNQGFSQNLHVVFRV